MQFVCHQLQCLTIVLPPAEEDEFDWAVFVSGGLHWEMKLLQRIIDVLWSFVYQSFATSCGYTTPQQLDWCRSGKDHHRTFNECSCFTDGVFDELLRPYVLTTNEPTAQCWVFFLVKPVSGQFDTFMAAAHSCTVLFSHLRLSSWHETCRWSFHAWGTPTSQPLIYGRNHLGFQLIELFEEFDHPSYPEELRRRFIRLYAAAQQVWS